MDVLIEIPPRLFEVLRPRLRTLGGLVYPNIQVFQTCGAQTTHVGGTFGSIHGYRSLNCFAIRGKIAAVCGQIALLYALCGLSPSGYIDNLQRRCCSPKTELTKN